MTRSPGGCLVSVFFFSHFLLLSFFVEKQATDLITGACHQHINVNLFESLVIFAGSFCWALNS